MGMSLILCCGLFDKSHWVSSCEKCVCGCFGLFCFCVCMG